MYKPSKYNYIVKNIHGDFLLYNTSQGVKSFYKLPAGRDGIISLLKAKQVRRDPLTDKLAQLGFLIAQEVNEDVAIESLYEKTVYDTQMNLIISPTDDCNFRCTYCCEDFEKKFMSDEVQQSILQYVEKNINLSSGLNIDWFGGEPLLALDIIIDLSAKLIQICKKAKKNFSSFITTNGYLLDLEAFEKLYKHHVFTYQISLDGVKTIHDKQRITDSGAPTFDAIFNNLLNIKKSGVGKFATILVLTNLSDCLEDDILEYKRLFHSNFSDDSRFAFACARIMDLGGSRIGNYSSHIINSDGMNKMYSKLMSIDDYNLNYNYQKFLSPGGLVCYSGKQNSYVIACDGQLYKCEHMYQTKREQPIGYLSKQGDMIIDQKKVEPWKATWDRCASKSCKLKPLCLGEDCINNRILDKQLDGKETCDFQLCHFEKHTLENILLLLDHDCNAFKNLLSYIDNAQP